MDHVVADVYAVLLLFFPNPVHGHQRVRSSMQEMCSVLLKLSIDIQKSLFHDPCAIKHDHSVFCSIRRISVLRRFICKWIVARMNVRIIVSIPMNVTVLQIDIFPGSESTE